MEQSFLNTCICIFSLSMTLISSCGGEERSHANQQAGKISEGEPINNESFFIPGVQSGQPQIAEYIRNIHEDKNGNLWFGTNGYGVAHFDGDSVSYYSKAQGFNGQQVTGITEDPQKNIWFATDQGVVKYDWSSTDNNRKRFTNYSDQQYFGGQRFWSICADSKSNIWAGSAEGIFRFDGVNWAPFNLPYPEEAETGDFITKRTSWSISEDSNGNLWFTTNGYGAFKYNPSTGQSDGNSFVQYTQKDGLTDDSVDHIMEDSNGNIWFGTRFGGVSRYDGKTFTNYTADNSIGNNEVCVIFEDKAENIWFSSEGFGVYRYSASKASQPIGEPFGQVKLSPELLGLTNYFKNEGLNVGAVQTIFEDRAGRLWVGGGGGLYRYDPSSERFINVTKYGPWE